MIDLPKDGSSMDSLPIAVSGANGFTGRFVCCELLKRRIPFLAVLRPEANPSWMLSKKIPLRFADLNNAAQLGDQLVNCRALLNVASIGFGAAPSIVKACKKANIKRAVFVSTTSIFTQLNTNSKAIRKAAEEAIKCSGLDATIMRPTMIYGTPGDRNMIKLVKWLDRWPILPVFGKGDYLQQPVHVSDVAWAVVEALNSAKTINKQFSLTGAAPLTFNQIINLTSQALGRNVYRIHLPAKIFVTLIKKTELLGINLPIKAEQIERLNENKAFSHADASKCFGYSPMHFEEGIKQEVALFRDGRDGVS